VKKYGACLQHSVLKYFVNYPNWGVSVQFCMFQFFAVFASFSRFLPVFSTVLAKILFVMAKPNPEYICIG